MRIRGRHFPGGLQKPQLPAEAAGCGDAAIGSDEQPEILPRSSWRWGRRGNRMKRLSSWTLEVGQTFDSPYPCTKASEKCRSRKNNDHWTEEEMIQLVDAISEKGIGRWRKVKVEHFSASIRTAVNLKDKWRNLVKACKAKNTSKKKFFHPLQANIQKATEVIVTRLRHRILALDAKHHRKKKCINLD